MFDKGAFSAAYSGFEGTEVATHATLADFLRSRGVTEVDVCGIATDYCVKATAVDAAAEGFATTVVLGLTAAVAPANLPAVRQELATAQVTVR